LARIIPVRSDWEVQQLGAKSFVVPFPNKEELDRMIAIDTFTTKNKEGTISFAEYEDDIQPIRLLEQTWVGVIYINLKEINMVGRQYTSAFLNQRLLGWERMKT
jgi:hypothetical protein